MLRVLVGILRNRNGVMGLRYLYGIFVWIFVENFSKDDAVRCVKFKFFAAAARHCVWRHCLRDEWGKVSYLYLLLWNCSFISVSYSTENHADCLVYPAISQFWCTSKLTSRLFYASSKPVVQVSYQLTAQRRDRAARAQRRSLAAAASGRWNSSCQAPAIVVAPRRPRCPDHCGVSPAIKPRKTWITLKVA